MSSPRGGSPGAEQHQPTATQTTDLDNEASADQTDQSPTCPWRTTQYQHGECERFFDCPSHTLERSPAEDAQQASHDEPDATSETVATNTTTTNIAGGETGNDGASDATRLASQLSLLGDRLGSADAGTVARHAHDAGPSTAQQQLPVAFLPPRSTSHMVPLQHPISLDHSLPPTPREEHPGMELDDPARSNRRRSTVTFQEEEGGEQSAPSRSSAARDHNLDRQGSFPAPLAGDRSVAQRSSPGVQDTEAREPSEFVLPRWQPDAEVTYCPICQTQFSIFVRKHHCRKCGRVVCNSCSPHRIIIPHQYIVRPPGSDIPVPLGLLYEGLTGGERVRLCNPCVPDPQTAPPQSPGAATGGPARSAHQRSRSSFGSGYGTASSSSRYPGAYTERSGNEQWRGYSARTRSITVVPGSRPGPSGSSSRAVHGSLQRLSQPGSSYPTRHSSLAGGSSSRNRTLPPTPQIAEEDECPICHRELPPRELPDFEAAREAHINACIQNHSTYGSPRTPATGDAESPGPAPPVRRTGMYKYVATEKDCIDDAECTICLEEFAVGVGMARLECLCRFHRSCIAAWFVNHPGRCPVHQHDGFGF